MFNYVKHLFAKLFSIIIFTYIIKKKEGKGREKNI